MGWCSRLENFKHAETAAATEAAATSGATPCPWHAAQLPQPQLWSSQAVHWERGVWLPPQHFAHPKRAVVFQPTPSQPNAS